MPLLPRSTSLTFALVFGFLSVLTIVGVSSGGLKADTMVVLAAATPPPAHLSPKFDSAEAVHREGGHSGAGGAAYGPRRDRTAQRDDRQYNCRENCVSAQRACNSRINSKRFPTRYQWNEEVYRCRSVMEACRQRC